MIDPAGISPWLMLVAPVVIVVAYTVFGLSGFGATAISVPILAHFLPVSYLVPLVALLDVMSSALIGITHRELIARILNAAIERLQLGASGKQAPKPATMAGT